MFSNSMRVMSMIMQPSEHSRTTDGCLPLRYSASLRGKWKHWGDYNIIDVQGLDYEHYGK